MNVLLQMARDHTNVCNLRNQRSRTLSGWTPYNQSPHKVYLRTRDWNMRDSPKNWWLWRQRPQGKESRHSSKAGKYKETDLPIQIWKRNKACPHPNRPSKVHVRLLQNYNKCVFFSVSDNFLEPPQKTNIWRIKRNVDSFSFLL